MGYVRAETTITAPRTLVYRYLADVSTYERFLFDSFALFDVTSPSSVGVGASLKYLAKISGKEPGELRITSAADPVRVAASGKHGATPFTLTFSLEEPERDRTTVTLEYSYEARGFIARLSDGMSYRPAARKAYQRALDRLAGILHTLQH